MANQKKARGHTVVNFNYKVAVSTTNNIVLELKNKLLSINYLPFNSELNGKDLQTCHTSLIIDRIVNKFSLTAKTTNNGLRDKAFEKYKLEDTALSAVDHNFSLWGPSLEAFHVRKAKKNLSHILRNFSLDIKKASISFSPGETFISQSGDVSILAKLAEREHWTTYDSCLYETCTLIYNNMSLKRIAKELIGPITRIERRAYYKRALDQSYGDNTSEIGFVVFSWILEDKLLRIVKGSRGASVPKNVEIDRFINVEAMFPCILQMLVGREIKRCLARNGNFLLPVKTQSNLNEHTGLTMVNRVSGKVFGLEPQWYHGKLIENPEFSTIDFKSASNSVSHKVVSSVFPNTVSKLLSRFRSEYVLLRDDEWYKPNMLSSMGNGFTFEVMSALLYALGCVFSPRTRVFGDDVIIPHEVCDSFTKAARYIGFNVNPKKSFVNSNFRESCGYFYHNDGGYLRSFDFTECETFQDVITTCNKLTWILDEVDLEINPLLEEARNDISAFCLALQRGPIPSHEYRSGNLGLYIWDRNWKRKHTASSTAQAVRKQALIKSQTYEQDIQRSFTDSALVYIPFYVNKLSKRSTSNRIRYGALLFSGMAVKRQIRSKGRWVNLLAFVDPDGSITLLRYITSRLQSRVVNLEPTKGLRRPNKGMNRI